MGRKIAIIFAAVIIGVTCFIASVVIVSRGTLRQQLVGGQPLSYWLLCLDADRASLRSDAKNALPQFGVAAVGPLIERLDSTQHETGEAAAAALAVIGPPAVPQLAASLHSGSAARRIAAIKLLASMGPASAPAVQDIAQLLDDPNVGPTAADYFVKLGAGRDAVKAAIRCLGGTDVRARLDAIRVLAEAPSDPDTAPALVKALKTTDPAVRDAAYSAICDLPVMPIEAIDVMIEKMTRLETRGAAAAALTKAGGNAIEPLSRLSANTDEAVRLDAVNLIRLILLTGTGGGETDALERFLNDTSVRVRVRARQSIDDVRLISASSGTASGRPTVPRDLVFSITPPAVIGPVMPDVSSLHLDPEMVPTSRPSGLNKPEVADAIAQLDDPSEAVRQQAEEVIRKAWSSADLLPDYNWTFDSAEKLRRIRLLPFSKDWRKYDLMISASNLEDSTLRKAAIGAMGRSLQSPRVIEKLVDLARHGTTSEIRCQAITALAPANKTSRVASALKDAMGDPDPHVSSAAQAALEYVPPLK